MWDLHYYCCCHYYYSEKIKSFCKQTAKKVISCLKLTLLLLLMMFVVITEKEKYAYYNVFFCNLCNNLRKLIKVLNMVTRKVKNPNVANSPTQPTLGSPISLKIIFTKFFNSKGIKNGEIILHNGIQIAW